MNAVNILWQRIEEKYNLTQSNPKPTNASSIVGGVATTTGWIAELAAAEVATMTKLMPNRKVAAFVEAASTNLSFYSQFAQ